jgi:hypothetical protein
MKKFRHLAITLLVVSCSVVGLATTNNYAKDSNSSIVIELDSLGIHPSILYNKQEIDQLKQAIALRQEPFYSTWLNLKSYCDGKLTYVSVPYTGNSSADYYVKMLLPASVVRNLAMAYQLSGNLAYGQKAVQMLSTYATACTGKLFDINIDFPNQSMKVARASFPFVCAYDLLINSGLIDPTTKLQVQAWFRQIEKQVKDGEIEWANNDYFDRQYYNNHLVAHTMSLLAIGIALDDAQLIQYAVDSKECPRDVVELIQGMILMNGDKDCARVADKPKENGEIMDRYRHLTAGGRGLQYASLVLNLFSPIGRMCTHRGWNLFEYTAPTGENLQLSYNYYSDFWRTKDSSIKGGYYGPHSQEDARLAAPADFIGNFEVGLAYYPNSKQLKDVVASFNRSSQHIDLLGYTAFFAVPTISTSINEDIYKLQSEKMKIFYSDGKVYLQNLLNKNGEIQIFNMSGQLLSKFDFNVENPTINQNLESGIFLIRVISNGNQEVAKLIIGRK